MRLKDLNSDKRDEESRNRPVRLSDLRKQNDIDPVIANEIRMAPLKLSQQLQKGVETSKAAEAEAAREVDSKLVERPPYLERVKQEASKWPEILRPVGLAVEAIAEAPAVRAIGETLGTRNAEAEGFKPVEGAGKIAGQAIAAIGTPLTVPGAGLGGGAMFNQAGGALARYAPKLGSTAGGRIAETAIKSAAEGAPLGVGTELALNPEASGRELAIAGALGAGGGAVLGGLGGAVGEGLVRLSTLRRKGVPEVAGQPVARSSDVSEELPPSPVRTSQEAVQDAQNTVRSSDAVPGQRKFMNTMQQSGKLTDEVSQGLSQSPEKFYDRITNVGTVERANQRIAQGLDTAEAGLMGKKRFTADDVATGMRLIDEFQKSGNTQRAVTVAERLARQLTEAGQTVQAASIWNRLTPEGALLAAQRRVNTINENLLRGQRPVKLSDEQAQGITDAASAIQASGASKERAGTVMEIMERMRKGEEIPLEDRQILADFAADVKRFLKPSDNRPPRPARAPKEMSDVRVRDRVTSFLEAQEQAAKERLRSKGVRISSNPLDVWADYAYIGALKIAKGAVKFADWSDQMVRDVGDSVRPYLREIWDKAQETLNQSAKKINEQTVSKAERIAESYLKSNEKTLAQGDIDLIRNMAQKVSSLSGKEQQMASQDLQAIMNGFEKAGIGRKLSTLQYLSMLLNPKTQIRNIVGNELLYRLERLSKYIGTPIDIVTSKLTGGKRTVTFKRGPRVWDDFFKSTKDYWTALPEGARAGARGVSPEGLTTKYEIQGQAFRSKYNPLTYMEKALGASLQGFDYAAYTRATNQRLSEMAYLDAINSGIKGANNIRSHMQTFMANMDDAVHTIAKDYGKYATLQDDSLLAKKLMGFRRGLNKVSTFGGSENFGLGSIVAPFAKTPANLLLRGLDYSPAGILKAVKQAYDVLRNPNTDLTRADVISSVSRAIMGSGMGAIAYWLADKGAMFGQSNKDSETRKLQQMAGIRDFQINGSAVLRMLEAAATGGDVDAAAKLQEGDTLWAYEWAQPSSMPMAIGSNIHQSVKQGQGPLQTTSEAALSGFSTLFNSSVLSGIREAFQIPPGEDNAVKAIGMNLVKQAPSMFTPSIVRNINTFLDNKLRESYTPDEALKIVNPARSGIPGQAQQMPQRVDTFGKPMTRPNSFIDVFVSPSDRSKYEPTPEAQFVLDLLNETGDTRVAPRAVPKYLSGKDIKTGLNRKVDLTPEQYVKLQTIVGEETAKRIMKINPNLSTEKKVERVLKAMDEAGKIGRNHLKKELGLRLTK